MKFKKLGKSGIMLPEVGLGTHNYSGGNGPLRRGIELGAVLIDTAEEYGTESIVGEAIRGQREKVFIATKVSKKHLRYQDMHQAADGSLERLGIDYIDLYQIHAPVPDIPIKETMRAMEELVDMGKVRFIGVSNFNINQLKEAQEAMRKYQIVANQVLYTLFERQMVKEFWYKPIEPGLLAYCHQQDVTVLAYSPLGMGVLKEQPFPGDSSAREVLRRIVEETRRTVAQIALNWCISKPNVIAIPKTDNIERVEQFCNASGWELAEKQMEALDEAFL